MGRGDNTFEKHEFAKLIRRNTFTVMHTGDHLCKPQGTPFKDLCIRQKRLGLCSGMDAAFSVECDLGSNVEAYPGPNKSILGTGL